MCCLILFCRVSSRSYTFWHLSKWLTRDAKRFCATGSLEHRPHVDRSPGVRQGVRDWDETSLWGFPYKFHMAMCKHDTSYVSTTARQNDNCDRLTLTKRISIKLCIIGRDDPLKSADWKGEVSAYGHLSGDLWFPGLRLVRESSIRTALRMCFFPDLETSSAGKLVADTGELSIIL